MYYHKLLFIAFFITDLYISWLLSKVAFRKIWYGFYFYQL